MSYDLEIRHQHLPAVSSAVVTLNSLGYQKTFVSSRVYRYIIKKNGNREITQQNINFPKNKNKFFLDNYIRNIINKFQRYTCYYLPGRLC